MGKEYLKLETYLNILKTVLFFVYLFIVMPKLLNGSTFSVIMAFAINFCIIYYDVKLLVNFFRENSEK